MYKRDLLGYVYIFLASANPSKDHKLTISTKPWKGERTSPPKAKMKSGRFLSEEASTSTIHFRLLDKRKICIWCARKEIIMFCAPAKNDLLPRHINLFFSWLRWRRKRCLLVSSRIFGCGAWGKRSPIRRPSRLQDLFFSFRARNMIKLSLMIWDRSLAFKKKEENPALPEIDPPHFLSTFFYLSPTLHFVCESVCVCTLVCACVFYIRSGLSAPASSQCLEIRARVGG